MSEPQSMLPYSAQIAAGEVQMRHWMIGREPSSLPASVWDAPKDCPLWAMGLSLAQAAGIWARAKSGDYSQTE